MFTAVWSTKGGVGVSTVAAMLAIAQSERAESSVVVDLCGDLPALLGLAEPDDLGIAEWFATPTRSLDALARIEIEARVDLTVLPRGAGPLPLDAGDLVSAFRSSRREVVVDCGRLTTGSFAAQVAEAAEVRLLVVRACYLTLRSVRSAPIMPTGVVLLRERGRSLGLADVESVVEAPVVADVAIDSAIARSIDAGLLSSRLPRALVRSMARVIPDAA